MAYALLLSAATAKVASMPIHSYDPYFYSYLASGQQARDFKQTVGLPHEWQVMPDSDIAYSRRFFTVKPLFVGLTRISASVVDILAAPFLISACAYFCLGWVVWGWLGNFRLEGHWKMFSALLLMFSSVATDTARQGTPDMLCTVLLVCGAWLLLSTRLKYFGLLLLLTAIFGRTDSLVFGGMLLALAAWRRRVSPRLLTLWSVVMLVGESLVARRGYSYSQFVTATLRSSYVHGFIHNFARTELAIYSPFLLMGLIAVKMRFQTDLILVCISACAIRYILLPHLEIRYMLPEAIVLGIVSTAAGFKTKHRSDLRSRRSSGLNKDIEPPTPVDSTEQNWVSA